MVKGRVSTDTTLQLPPVRHPTWGEGGERVELAVKYCRGGRWITARARLASRDGQRVFCKTESGTTGWIPVDDLELA